MGCQGSQASWSSGPLRLFNRVQPIQNLQERVEAEPARPRRVRLQGTVGDRVPLLNGQVYQLTDATGSIWVVTTDTTVTSGERLLIQGQVHYEAMADLGSRWGEAYIEELEQIRRE
ncbi:MAG: hypothetical protein VKK04_13320 [Synechococcales bacterium]|nr:hypothetical protein [Synechococcales bacterium]